MWYCQNALCSRLTFSRHAQTISEKREQEILLEDPLVQIYIYVDRLVWLSLSVVASLGPRLHVCMFHNGLHSQQDRHQHIMICILTRKRQEIKDYFYHWSNNSNLEHFYGRNFFGGCPATPLEQLTTKEE